MASILRDRSRVHGSSEKSEKQAALAIAFEQLARNSYIAKPDFISKRIEDDFEQQWRPTAFSK